MDHHLEMDDDLREELYGEHERLRRRNEVRADRIRLAIENLLQTEDGRLFFEYLFGLTRINATIFTGNSKTFFNQGVQAVGLTIKGDIMSINPELFFEIERRMYQKDEGKS